MCRLRVLLVAVLLLAGCGAESDQALVRAEAEPTTTTTVELEPDVLPVRTPPPTTTTTAPPPPATTTTHYHPPTTQPPVVQAAAAPPAAYQPTGRCGGWEELVAAYFPADQVAKGCQVLMCESGGNPRAENPRSSASGLWQFLASTWESTTGTPAPASAYSPGEQTAAAAALWRSSGWSPWSCA